MKQTNHKRRKLIKSLLAIPFFGAFTTKASARTPSAAEGPFYPTPSMRYKDDDNNLVKIEGEVKQAGGEIMTLQGRVLDSQGKPIVNARVEIWQCDANGRYLHSGDNNNPVPLDSAFQGFGHSISNENGTYTFRTIKPVSYPGRTPHIHVKVFAKNRELTSQFYLHNHPENQRDFLFQRMTLAEQKAVSMVVEKGQSGLETTVDITV